MNKTSFWKTRCSDLTVGQSVKFGLLAGVLACVPYAIAAVVMYKDKDEVKEWCNDHFRKAQREVASEENEEDWGT